MPEPEITELVELDIERVDGVGSPANGTSFILMKKLDDGSMSAETVAKDLGDELTPGSPEWEAQDAANLHDVATQLVALKDRLTEAAARERTEAMSTEVDGDDDYQNAWDLDDALCALDCALSLVARLAFTEAGEASETDAGDGAVTKAGKRLSSKSEAAIRSARDALSDLLGDGDDQAQTEEVEKMTKDELKAVVTDVVAEALAPIQKAVSELETARTEAPAEDVSKSEAETAEDAAADVAKSDETEAPAAAAEAATDVAKAEGDEPVEPATQVIKADELTAVLKSTVDEVIKAAVSPLEERLAKVESQPMPGAPLMNGVAKSAGAAFLALRGQDGTEVETQVAALQKALDEETDPIRKGELANQISLANLRARYGA